MRLTSVSTGGSGGEDRLAENVTFAYASVVEAYERQLLSRGSSGGRPPGRSGLVEPTPTAASLGRVRVPPVSSHGTPGDGAPPPGAPMIGELLDGRLAGREL